MKHIEALELLEQMRMNVRPPAGMSINEIAGLNIQISGAINEYRMLVKKTTKPDRKSKKLKGK